MIEGFKIYEINKYITIDDKDLNDFDQILHSTDSLIVIKKYWNEEELKKNWYEQVYFTGGYIQNKFDDLELPKECLWNTYIVYLVNFDISSELKVEIETDKFCCKKYVVDIRNSASESEAIIRELPALTSLIIGVNPGGLLKDDLAIKKMFVTDDKINEEVKKYFLEMKDLDEKPIQIVIDEMIGRF
ncbi:ABC-three component system middle component 1 [Clostridium beijerinckii]|uniref:ABC-three component system middle component 1 n=1 Tax=Clostridium beijerinckii TaxID=1520 RepID=UPI00080A3D71|nr:ABC-three component system middle component 1 [Clostridium beijerinckii]OCB00425.1 hypothetical protein BGS1_15915 [Clostridium beijerinckii]